MSDTTVKVSAKTYKTIRALADDSGMSVREVVDSLVNEGLNNAKEVGKVVSLNNNLVGKLKNDIDELRRSNAELAARLDDVEDEDAIELTKESLLKRAIKPVKKEMDGMRYLCKDCLAEGKEVELDIEEKPERCPECGRKINWKGEEGGNGLGLVLVGLLALSLVGGLNRRV
jgi:DNA-directed RNA polymerase, subunit RPC10 (contains C4-type Zn-finger)